jgi:hypothetical protein
MFQANYHFNYVVPEWIRYFVSTLECFFLDLELTFKGVSNRDSSIQYVKTGCQLYTV